MTREDCKNLIHSIFAIYPNWHPANLTETVNSWYFILNDYEVKDILYALKAYSVTNTSGFAPAPGQLIALLTKDTELNALEAWSLVHKAICNSGYHAKEEYEKLPSIVQRAVGSAENLRSWGMVETESMPVIQANFVKTYNAVKESHRREQIISGDLQKKLAAVAERLQIGGKE